MFRALFGFLTYVFTAALIIIIGGGLWMITSYKGDGPLLNETTFIVEKGQGLSGIADELERQGVIENRYVFMVGTRATGKQSVLKAGEYLFDAHISPYQITEKLSAGDTVIRRFTIPEGRTSYEIVQIINNVKDLSGKIEKIPTEGALLPNTYDYAHGEDRNAVITRMQETMTETIDQAWENRAPDLPFTTKEEALTLASIVEKETGQPEERARVAGVFINRLRRGIPLQTDPTVIYALTKGKHQNEGQGPLGRRLLKKDLQIDSPYNTYKNAGLPPGPIANPGKESITATLNPENHEFIYFVADGTGGHAFAKTLAEHEKNVSEWRKIRRNQN